MKKNLIRYFIIFIFVIAFGTMAAFADDYYVSNSGDDGNSGISSAAPWKTLSKVNDFDFEPGDVVHFENGSIWRDTLVVRSGKKDQNVTYTSYGRGEQPLFLGSIAKNQRTDWEKKSGDIWITKMDVKAQGIRDIGNIIFDNGEKTGVKVFTMSELKKQNDFWYDKNNDALAIYSDKNPAEMYNSVECALMKNIIDLDGKSYVVIDGLALKYSGGCGIFGEDTQYIKILNCDISYIGGGILYWEDGKPERYGNAINFWNNNHDNLVEGCRIWEIYDTAVTNQGNGEGNRQYNITYRNNKIWNVEYSFEYWNQSDKGLTHDIYFENNTCRDAGYGWGYNQRPDRSGNHITLFNNAARTTGIYIRNNIFDNARYSSVYVSSIWNDLENVTIENNTYYQPESSLVAYWKGKKYSAAAFESYKLVYRKDAGSVLSYDNQNDLTKVSYSK